MDAILLSLVQGQLTSAQLPAAFDLSDIVADMEQLWQGSIADNRERGACIVFDETSIQLIHEVQGTGEGLTPLHRARDYNDHAGFFHTHLYKNGTEQVGFSDTDFGGVLEDGECLSVVRSGIHVFALVRTELTRPPAEVDENEVNDFLKVFEIYEFCNVLTTAQVQLWANLYLCHRHWNISWKKSKSLSS